MKRHRLGIAIVILVFVATAYVLGWSTFFTVSSVEITGTKTLITTDIKVGERLARVEPRSIVAELERIKWIRSVEVSRNWITGKVSIAIVERTPIAIFNEQVIDEEGVSFLPINQSIQGLPHIQAMDIDAAITAANFFNSLPKDFADAITTIKVATGDSYSIEMSQGEKSIELLWGQDGENSLKIRVYKALIARPENFEIQRIDLSAPHAPIVK
ncbi:MAG: FtsQ-type POTRA domain-containing protein [Candidatus Planktophila sp.]|nr:FtsQ-type POTRA domain-containing protein [Candidatus Planktophila sp.]